MAKKTPKEDPVKEEVKTVEEPKKDSPADSVEDKDKDPVVDSTPEPETPTPEAIAEETKTQVYETVKSALGIETKEGEEEYQTPWQKRGDANPKDWTEVTQASVELSERRRLQAEAQAKEAADNQEKLDQEAKDRMNKEWDNELAFLRSKEYIPAVDKDIQAKLTKGENLTDEEKNDPGLVAQAELFSTMNKLHQSGSDSTTSLRAIYHDHYQDNKKEPAGADAPISGGSKSVDQSVGYSYDDVSKQTIGQIMRKNTGG